MPTKQNLLIVPPTPYGLACADVIEDIPGAKVAGFIECLDQQRTHETYGGLPIHWIEDLSAQRHTHGIVCALGSTDRDNYVRIIESQGLKFPTLLHPTSQVSTRATIEEGSFLDVNSIVAAYSKISRHSRLARGSIIGHHTYLGEYVTVAPGANIAGHCNIGDHTYIGMSAVIRDHVKVGQRSIVGAGAVVTKDVPDHVTVVGVPARIIGSELPPK